jgi:hypothetical protein
MKVLSLVRSAPVLFGIGLAGFACQSIADIPEDVRYSAQCEDYCAEMRTQCNGATIAQYPNEEACFAACHAIGDRSKFAEADNSNTVFCRTLRAEQTANAPGDKPDLCATAGPGGKGGEAGCTDSKEDPYCEGYCTLYINACNGKSSNPFKARQEFGIPGTDTVQNINDCIDACRAVPPIPAPGFYAFGNSESGDTLACRLHWATIAALSPTEENCVRAGLRPQGDCEAEEPECEDFCRTAMVACPSSWDDLDHCLRTCGVTEPITEKEDIVGPDTTKCRNTHAFVALLVNPHHCAHAGVLGSNVCGGNCDAYCRLAKAACPGYVDDEFFEKPAGKDAKSPCVEECEGLDGVMSESPEDYTVEAGEKGNSVQCRALHASRALDEELSMEETAELCDAAFGAKPCN